MARGEAVTQRELFQDVAREPQPQTYPDVAGWKEPTTSQEAAEQVDASTLRAAVVVALTQFGDITADECAARLKTSVLSIRPRFSELRAKNQIVDSGVRRLNDSGKRAIVWHLIKGRRRGE